MKRNISIRFLVVLLVGLVAPSVYGRGDEIGSGGNVIWCDIPTQPRTRVLDFYETTQLMQLHVGLPSSPSDPMQIINGVLDRLKRIDPYRAASYRASANAFYANAAMLPGINLTLIPDAFPQFVPAGCELKQLANQKKPTFPFERLYTIDGDLWGALDAANQATLILHEIAYGEALGFGHTNSLAARKLTGYLISSELGSLDVLAYRNLLSVLGYPYQAATDNFPCEGVRVPGDYADLKAAVVAMGSRDTTICLAAGHFPAFVFDIQTMGHLKIVGQGPESTVFDDMVVQYVEGSVSFQQIGFDGLQVGEFIKTFNLDRALVKGKVILGLSGFSSEFATISITNSVFSGASGITVSHNGRGGGNRDNGKVTIANNLFQGNDVALKVDTSVEQNVVLYVNNLFVANHLALDLGATPDSASGHNGFEFNTTNFAGEAAPQAGDLRDDLALELSASPARLSSLSRARGTGNKTVAPAYDYFGNPRGSVVDLGPVQVTGIIP